MAPLAQLARALLLGSLLALFARTYLLQLYRVPSDSMEPGLLPGDHVAIDRFLFGGGLGGGGLDGTGGGLLPAREPRRFDVVVLKGPDGFLIKRLLGLPGERVEVKDHLLWADGAAVDAGAAWLLLPDAASPGSARVPADFGPLRLGPGEYLALGDQRGVSLDSRVFGPVSRRDIVGRAFMIYWSIPIEPAADDASFAKIPGPARSKWLAARWNRCFRPLR